MRQQDIGNKFVFIDKETDKIKGNEQIGRSSFIKLDQDPTKEHITKVKQWADKWFERKEILKEWHQFVINNNHKHIHIYSVLGFGLCFFLKKGQRTS